MTAIKLPVRVEESLCVGLAGEPEWMIVDATGCMVEEFSTRNRAERRAAALNAQERVLPRHERLRSLGYEMLTDDQKAQNRLVNLGTAGPCDYAQERASEPDELRVIRDALGTLADKAGASCGDRYEKLALAAYFACDRLEAHIDTLTRALDMQRQATEEAVRRAEATQRELVAMRQGFELCCSRCLGPMAEGAPCSACAEQQAEKS